MSAVFTTLQHSGDGVTFGPGIWMNCWQFFMRSGMLPLQSANTPCNNVTLTRMAKAKKRMLTLAITNFQLRLSLNSKKKEEGRTRIRQGMSAVFTTLQHSGDGVTFGPEIWTNCWQFFIRSGMLPPQSANTPCNNVTLTRMAKAKKRMLTLAITNFQLRLSLNSKKKEEGRRRRRIRQGMSAVFTTLQHSGDGVTSGPGIWMNCWQFFTRSGMLPWQSANTPCNNVTLTRMAKAKKRMLTLAITNFQFRLSLNSKKKEEEEELFLHKFMEFVSI
ncbi:uncharacterized protein G2W53_016023 [Senna tora]|uniref:Uncharacterized protein n=1 Tax=Senna tora TaxID=362788 RepID=A0A834WVV0_9FABA|nr:uncharacterized protein G2W53_016023 [Senna tora]